VGVSRFRPGAATLRLGGVPRFLVESYVAVSERHVREAVARARETAELGTGIRYVETTYLPGDETVLHLFEACSPESLTAAAERAGLQFERIVPAVHASGNRRKEHLT
jgi:hypothetical protein